MSKARYEAREFQPGGQMFDQGTEDHCWVVVDTETGQTITEGGFLERVARERAEKLNKEGKEEG